jgi:hypothetical protein
MMTTRSPPAQVPTAFIVGVPIMKSSWMSDSFTPRAASSFLYQGELAEAPRL